MYRYIWLANILRKIPVLPQGRLNSIIGPQTEQYTRAHAMYILNHSQE